MIVVNQVDCNKKGQKGTSKAMKTYKIIGKTNGYIANRDIHFNGKTEITLETGLTLKEAQKKLLKMFCEEINEYVPNWGVATRIRSERTNGAIAYPSHKDGTRTYEFDSRYYSVEEEDEE